MRITGTVGDDETDFEGDDGLTGCLLESDRCRETVDAFQEAAASPHPLYITCSAQRRDGCRRGGLPVLTRAPTRSQGLGGSPRRFDRPGAPGLEPHHRAEHVGVLRRGQPPGLHAGVVDTAVVAGSIVGRVAAHVAARKVDMRHMCSDRLRGGSCYWPPTTIAHCWPAFLGRILPAADHWPPHNCAPIGCLLLAACCWPPIMGNALADYCAPPRTADSPHSTGRIVLAAC